MPNVVGWLLDEAEREQLLARFPPRYPQVVAHHVTHRARAPQDEPLPGEVQARIVGEADDGAGVQALVVRIDGETDRWDGSTYHVTWSLAPNRRAVESNAVIRLFGWEPLPETPLALTPARF